MATKVLFNVNGKVISDMQEYKRLKKDNPNAFMFYASKDCMDFKYDTYEDYVKHCTVTFPTNTFYSCS